MNEWPNALTEAVNRAIQKRHGVDFTFTILSITTANKFVAVEYLGRRDRMARLFPDEEGQQYQIVLSSKQTGI